MAAYFLANRLLPLGIAGRSDQEIDTMFIAWGAVAVWALARIARRAWPETLAATALASAAVPLANALTTARSLFARLANRKSTRLKSSHSCATRMPSSA